MNEAIMAFAVCMCMCMPVACFSDFAESKQTFQYLAKDIIQKDDEILILAKSALYDYTHSKKFSESELMRCRERIVNRYQEYKMMKRDNEYNIPRKYMVVRMDEFLDFLQSLPPV